MGSLSQCFSVSSECVVMLMLLFQRGTLGD
uniref:Uncharacterized protein n=1 Tax=Anguilla anguilla TaxID=7936 RepID=A0A0E9V6E1_ANGAN